MAQQGSDPSPALWRMLKALPKVELHRHLEGSLRVSTVAEIARRHRLNLPAEDEERLRRLIQMTPQDKPSAEAFIAKFGVLRHLYRSLEIVDRVAYEAVVDAAAENIVYLELRFTPVALAHAGGFPLGEVADVVLAAVRRAEAETGITVRLIVSMNRHEDPRLGEQCVALAAERMDKGIVGVDLAGLENYYTGGAFAPLFRQAQAAGLAVTVHAGEWAGPQSIREAVEQLGAQRLGHGVRVLEDLSVVALVRERSIALEVCPTSNVQTGVVKSLDKHPLRALYEMGLHTTINTDDPSISGITLTDEYLNVMRHLHLSIEDIKQHVLNAAQAAFLPSAEREGLIRQLRAELNPAEQTTNAPAP